MPVVRSLSELEAHLRQTVERVGFSRQPVAFSAQDAWSFTDGMLSHRSGGFFHVVGYRDKASGREELLLYQPQDAFNGLVVHRSQDRVYGLLQARVEPGIPRIGTYGPTVQSTAANYLRLHGGRATTHLELFFSYHPGVMPICGSTQFDFGRHYYQKAKTIRIVEARQQLPPGPGMVWVDLRILPAALARDHLIGTDLRSLLATVDWDQLVGKPPPTIRVSGLEGLPGRRTPGWEGGRFVPLDSLKDWRIGERAIEDTAARGRWVGMHRVHADSREVEIWTQPLMAFATPGRAALLTREGPSGPEFLISLGEEVGLSDRLAVRPSYVRAAGDDADTNNPLKGVGQTLHQVTHAEEGGRFLQHQCCYQVIRVAPDFPGDRHQRWIDPVSLKAILMGSNRGTIELRCLASLVLPLLNPRAFSGTDTP